MEEGITKYRQIAEDVRRDIETGKYRKGDRLPSQAQLIERYGVAQMTVRQAMQLLGSWGIVRYEHGRGSFVA